MTLLDYAPVPEELPQFLAGALMLALAAVVLRVRFDAALNRAFGLYLVLAGVYNITGALDDTLAVRALASATLPYFLLAVPPALAYLAMRYHAAEHGARAPRWASAALLVAGVAVVGTYFVDRVTEATLSGRDMGWLYIFGIPMAMLVSSGVALGFAVRAAKVGGSADTSAHTLGVIAFAALVLEYGAASAAMFASGLPAGGTTSPGIIGHAVRLLAGVVASVAVVRAARADRARAGGVLAVGALAVASGVVAEVLADRFGVRAVGNLVQGVWQLALPVLLGWAILRHQLLGLDVKVRWTLSKSTVAAAFVAAFFVASEGAQLVFGGENPYVGLVAAGALVFAIAPLQRAADRLAERAVPLAAPPPTPPGAPDARAAYRTLLRRFLADGRLTEDEESALAALATTSGLTPHDVLVARREVEAGLRGA